MPEYGFEWQFDIENMESFKAAMRSSKEAAERGLWHGTSASLGAFRRDFLKQTPVNIRGRNQKRNPKTVPEANQRSARTLASRFRYEVKPRVPAKVKRRYGPQQSAHVPNSGKPIVGDLFTKSKAAFGMETGPTITPKGPWLSIPIVRPGAPNAAKLRAGQKTPRAKPSWKSVRKILKKRGYNFQWKNHGNERGYMVLFARHKSTRAKPWPVMLLVKRVEMKPDTLAFMSTWNRWAPGNVPRRFEREIQKMLDHIAFTAGGGTRRGRQRRRDYRDAERIRENQ